MELSIREQAVFNNDLYNRQNSPVKQVDEVNEFLSGIGFIMVYYRIETLNRQSRTTMCTVARGATLIMLKRLIKLFWNIMIYY